MKRRALLASIGTATVGLAGCLAGDGDPSPEGRSGDGDGRSGDGDGRSGDGDGRSGDGDAAGESTDGDYDRADETDPAGTDDGTPAGEPTASDVEPTLVAGSVETAETGCGNGSEDVDVEFGGDGVRIDGVASTPDPCREAVIESSTVEAGELRVEFGFEPTDGACVDCVGAVEYVARFDVEGADGLDTVVVGHGEGGGVHGVTRASEGAAPPPQTPDDTPTDDGTTGTESGPRRHASEVVDSDLPVVVENRHDAAHEIQVTVVGESGAAVYDEALELAAESNRRAYNLREANPDGIETFGVRAAADGQTDSVRVKTSACYGRVIVAVDADGDFDVTYSVC